MILKIIIWIAIIVVLILNIIVQHRNHKRFLKWSEKGSKKEPPKCGGSCCK